MNFLNFNVKEIAIDLGTTNIVVGVKKVGIILKEPTVLAYNPKKEEIVAIGQKAMDLVEKMPDTLKIIRPFKDGVIADYTNTLHLLRTIMKMASKDIIFGKPKVLIGIPVGITEIERRAIEEALIEAGAGEIKVIYDSVAATIGLGVDVMKPDGRVIVDIGGGRTQISTISVGSVISKRSLKIAGNYLDNKIIEYLKKRLELGINTSTAENLKINLGCAIPIVSDLSKKIRGIDTKTGVPKSISITSKDIKQAMEKHLMEIMEAIIGVLSESTPELLSDILKNGIYVIGGGAYIKNLDTLIFEKTGVRTYIVDSSNDIIMKGMLKVLDNIDKYRGAILYNN